MMFHANLINENPISMKITSKDNEIKELENKTEKHDYDKFLKSLKIDNDCCRMK